MSDTQPVSLPDHSGGVLRRLNQLGASAGELFYRFYESIDRRSKIREQAAQLARQSLELQRQRHENERLRRELRDKQIALGQMEHIIETIDEGVVLQALDGRVTHINPAAHRILGSQKAIFSSPLATLFDPYRHITEAGTPLVPLGTPQRLTVGSKTIMAQIAAMGDEQGQRIGTLILLRDVTAEDQADRLRRSFVSHVSHELNTPMHVIRGASDYLTSQPEDAPANQRMLTLLGRNVDTLAQMVDDLLEISEISGGSLQIVRESLSLETLLLDLTQRHEAPVAEAGLWLWVMITDADRLRINGDADRLDWALSHLLKNAINYTERGGDIRVAARPNKAGDGVEIQVADTGVGISDEDKPHIFDLFYRGEAYTPEGKLLDPRGLGQGLYIARAIAQAHGGEVTVDSVLGEGSRFTLHLPLKASG